MTYEQALRLVIDAAGDMLSEQGRLNNKWSDDLEEAINIVSERAKVDAGDFSI